MDDRLTALDATFLELEEGNEGALMSIGGVMVFDPLPGGGAPSAEEIRATLAPRVDFLPRYSQRLSCTRVPRLAWPRWVADEHFDIANHIRLAALPAPGGREELCDWAADFYSHRLDRTRPLWEIVVVHGLAGGRWALAHKTHHCLVDGVGSVDVAYVLLDPAPTPGAPEGAPVPPSTGPNGLLRTAMPDWLAPVTQAAGAGVRAVAAGVHATGHVREALQRSRGLAELLVHDELIAAPQTSINCPIGSTRRFAVVDASVSELAALRSELGGTVNDIVLAACTAGLRRLLLGRGELPPARGLRAMVPMNLRVASERLALGNRITSLFVDLPVARRDARGRYREIMAKTAQLKASPAAAGADSVVQLAGLAPPILHAQLARSLYADRLFNVTITNVPGPQIPLYALGSQLREVHPVVPLAADHAVGIAAFSCHGQMSLGVIADRDSTPDIAVLADGIRDGIDELRALAAPHRRRTQSRK